MRVIAGRWRGRRLQAPRGRTVRPTSDRVKSAIFSLLGRRVAGVEVADLCCGAGGLGIEALSRGANFVHFVDRAAPVLRQVAANLARCEADPASYRLVRGGAEGWLAGCHGRDFVRPLIVLADPPYGSDLAARLVAGLGALPPTVPLLVAVIEHAPRETPALAASVALGCRHKRYGNTALTILEA